MAGRRELDRQGGEGRQVRRNRQRTGHFARVGRRRMPRFVVWGREKIRGPFAWYEFSNVGLCVFTPITQTLFVLFAANLFHPLNRVVNFGMDEVNGAQFIE